MKKKALKRSLITTLVAGIGILALQIINPHPSDVAFPVLLLTAFILLGIAFSGIIFTIVFGISLIINGENDDFDIKEYLSDIEGDYGFIDKTDKVVIPCTWNGAGDFSEGLAPVMNDKEEWGYIDKTGQVVIPCQWASTDGFSEGLAPVMNDKEKWGYIDKTGQEVIPCQWASADGFSGGLAPTYKWEEGAEGCIFCFEGFIDKTGQVAIPPNGRVWRVSQRAWLVS